MDWAAVAEGAVVGLIVGPLYGRFAPANPRRPRHWGARVLWFVPFGLGVLIAQVVGPLMPLSFWIAMLVVGWFAEPVGHRFRTEGAAP